MRKQKEDARKGITEIVSGSKLLLSSVVSIAKELYSIHVKGNKNLEEDDYAEADEECMEESDGEYAEDNFQCGNQKDGVLDENYSKGVKGADSIVPGDLNASEDIQISDALLYEDSINQDNLNGSNKLDNTEGIELSKEGASLENPSELFEDSSTVIEELKKSAPDSPTLQRVKQRMNNKGEIT